MVDKRIYEVLNHILTLIVFSIIVFKTAKSECFNMLDNFAVLLNITFSIGLTFFLWSKKW